jgi:hypothetical protein
LLHALLAGAAGVLHSVSAAVRHPQFVVGMAVSSDVHMPCPVMCCLCLQDSIYTTCTVPFLACGDLSGWDADRSYRLELPDSQQQQQGTGQPPAAAAGAYVPLEPVQKPMAPVYRTAVEQLRSQGNV